MVFDETFGTNPPRAVREVMGDNTGERIIIASDGTHWTLVDHLGRRGTGDRQAYLKDGKLFEL